MKFTNQKITALFMALGIMSLLPGCIQDKKNNFANEYIPTLQEVDSVQRSNVAGVKINNEDSLFTALANYQIAGFGHYHDKTENYHAFQKLIPRLRKAGFVALAVELPTSDQSLLDSIMDENTPADVTNALLTQLNSDLKLGERFLKFDPAKNEHHPLFDVILDWLKTGGVIVAIDVPFIYDSSTGHNKYYDKIMCQTIKEQSTLLYQKIEGTDINHLDAKDNLSEVSEIRSAYMAAIMNYYKSKGQKIVCFLGVKHLLLKVRPVRTVSVSIPQINREFFNTNVFCCYPYFSSGAAFFQGHSWLGNVAYSVER